MIAKQDARELVGVILLAVIACLLALAMIIGFLLLPFKHPAVNPGVRPLAITAVMVERGA